MREADPDDPIFKIGYVIGEKRLKNSPKESKQLRKAERKDTGKQRKQIEQEERLINEPYTD